VLIDDKFEYNMTLQGGSNQSGWTYFFNTTLSLGWHNFSIVYFNQNTSKREYSNTSNWPHVFSEGSRNNEVTLTEGKVNPTIGNTSTIFNFSMTYINEKDELAANAIVMIDDIFSVSLTPDLVNAADGATYSATHQYSNESAHFYYFEAYWNSTITRLPETGYYQGPIVNNSAIYLKNGTVTPKSGQPYTIFNYTVLFKTSTGDKANETLVYIDNQPFKMNEMPGQYLDEYLYYYTTNLTPGMHDYYFYFTTSNASRFSDLREPDLGIMLGPDVDMNMSNLASANVSATEGNVTTPFTFRFVYNNTEYPLNLTDVMVEIDMIPHNMTYVSGDNRTNAVFEYTTTLEVGPHFYAYIALIDIYPLRIPENPWQDKIVTVDDVPLNLYYGTVTPAVGFENDTTFEFSVFYSDVDATVPLEKYLYVNDTVYNMTYDSGSNRTGAKYIYTTSLLAGNYEYWFEFTDNFTTIRYPDGYNLSGPSVSKPGGPLNYPPVLVNGTVTPPAGTNQTLFTYRVYYMDANGDPPSQAQVSINGVPHNMTGYTGNYVDGVLFEYKTYLDAGNYNYNFNFKDINNSAARLPVVGYYNGPTVLPAPNEPPQLSNGSVNPKSGNTSTLFTFKVQYADYESDLPIVKEVYIDGYPYVMSYNPNEYVPIGRVYTYSSYLGAGNHSFYFHFNDSLNKVLLPQSGSFAGPSVAKLPGTSNNTAPYLSNGYVSPSKGTPTTNFTYYVYYYDAENATPTLMHVSIDGKLHQMTPAYSYPATPRGMYSYTTTLPVGNHTFYFIFSDGVNTVRLPSSGNLSGPEVTEIPPPPPPPPNNAPLLSSGAVSPTQGYDTTEFTFTVDYHDDECDIPTLKMIYIDGKSFVMTFKSGTYKGNATFEYKTTLAVGKHYFHFLFSDGKNTIRLPVRDSFYGPVVVIPNRAPHADAGSDQEHTVGPPHTVYLDGSNSSDPDGDKLTYFWDFGDGGYAFGIRVSHVFHGVGTYNVTLRITDGWLNDVDHLAVKIIDSGQGKAQGKAPRKSPKINDGEINMVAATIAASFASTAIIAGALVGGTEWGKYAALGLLFPLYVRISGKRILDNFTRGKIYGYIIANPGDHYNSIKSSLKLKNGALAYHLQALEREDLIKAQTDGKFKRFYPFEMSVPSRSTKLSTMRQNIVNQIEESPGITQNEISDKMGVSHQAISYHLRSLVQLGAVNIEKKGRANHCFPGEYSGELVMENEEKEWPR
jgi:uncharacterized membrane protein